jgi:hypothetical protein
MSEGEHSDYKQYGLKFGQICSPDDEYLLAWKSELTKSLFVDHLEATKDMDSVNFVNKFRYRPPGYSIEDICNMWDLPWQLVKNMVEDGRLTAFLDISFWHDNDGKLIHNPAGIYIHAEGIDAREKVDPILRERHTRYNHQKREREEHENQRIVNERIRAFSEEIEILKSRIYELQSLNEQIQGENTRLKDCDTATYDCTNCKSEDNHINEWIKDVECAVALTAKFMETGEKGCTAFHAAEWKTRRGGIRKRAFEAFRRSLPGHLKEQDPKKK